MTGLKKTLTAQKVKPIVKYQQDYKYLWLWGSFSPLTGEALYWETPFVNNLIFEAFLEELSQKNLRKYIILVIDNAGFHACQNIKIPENIHLLRIPPYSPELNPAEKVWQYMKDRLAIKFNDTIEDLQKRVTKLVNTMDNLIIKSITNYDIYTKHLIE